MLATSGFLTALECTKVVFGHGSALAGPRWGSLLRPRPPSWFKGDPILLRGWKVSGGEGPDWAPVAPLFWPTLYNLLILFLFYVPNKSIEFF